MSELEIEKLRQEKKRKELLLRETFGKGLLHLLFDRDDISEISLNQDSYLWIDIIGKGYLKTEHFIDEIRARMIIESVAAYNNKIVNTEFPSIDAVLPFDFERFNGVIGDSVNNLPIFSIRKRSKKVFSLDEMEEKGVITHTQNIYLKKSVITRKNILVVGGTSSGKTTFTNACLQELKNSEDRIIIIEETPELRLDKGNVLNFRVTEALSMRNCVQISMRENPDRIMIGELRKGSETIELLKAWNTGHEGGLCTIHANNSEQAIDKLEQFISEEISTPQQKMIANSVDIIVFLKKENNLRKVHEIKELIKYDSNNNEYIFKEIN